MRKKKNEKKKVILLIITILVILLSLVIFIDDDRKLTSGEKIIKNSVLTISNILSTPFFALKKNLSFNKNYETDISNLESIGINIELLKENEELKKTLELNNTLSERSYINATVINRNISYWFNELTINKGSSDGIKDGMAVINSDGLIGKIIKTSNNTSVIKLLTDENMTNKISVKIEYDGRFVYGLLSNYKDSFFLIDGISDNTNIDKGAKVVTSGLTDSFPSGILIGYVEEISTDNFDLSKTLKVKSKIDFNDIRGSIIKCIEGLVDFEIITQFFSQIRTWMFLNVWL